MYERPLTNLKHVLQVLLHLKNGLQLGEEPLVDIRHLPDLLDAVPTVEGRGDRKDALVRRIHELLVDILNKITLRSCPISSTSSPQSTETSHTDLRESRELIINSPDSLLDRLLE